MFLKCTIFTLNVNISICFCMGSRHAHLCINDYPYYSCIGFCHAHLCMNDYPYYFLWVFVMHIFVRMTIHIILVWVFIMHISVLMTIHIIMGFRHAHLCPIDYPYFLYGFLSWNFFYEWISIFLRVFAMHISVRMNIDIILVPNFFQMRFY